MKEETRCKKTDRQTDSQRIQDEAFKSHQSIIFVPQSLIEWNVYGNNLGYKTFYIPIQG